MKRSEKGKANLQEIVLAAVMAATFFAAVTRAAVSNITDDEAYTYLFFVRHINFFDFDTLRTLFTECLANNHWLNSLAINIAERICGTSYSEFIVRLPSLLSYALFLAAVWLARRRRMFSFPCALLLCGNYYLNEFYGLGRGYGMANTFVFLACLCWIGWKRTGYHSARRLTWCALFLLLGAAGNTIVLMIFPAFGLLWLLRLSQAGELKSYLLRRCWFILPFFAGAVLLAVYHMNVSAEDKPLYVGDDSFLRSTMASFVRMFVRDPAVIYMAGIFCAALLVFCAARLRRGLLQCDFFLIFLMFAATNILMQQLLHKGYMTDRVTLPFYGFMVLTADELLGAALGTFPSEALRRRIAQAASVGILLACAVVFVHKFDVYTTQEWTFDYGRREAIAATYMERQGVRPPVAEPFDYTNIFYFEKYEQIWEQYRNPDKPLSRPYRD